MTLNEEIRFLKLMGATVVHDKVIFANLFMDAMIEGKVQVVNSNDAMSEYEEYVKGNCNPTMFVYEQLNELDKPTGVVGWLMIGDCDVTLRVDHM